jgi:hypothetical protein
MKSLRSLLGKKEKKTYPYDLFREMLIWVERE